MIYKAVLFDLDGTLLNSIEDLAGSMNTVLAREGFPTHEIEEYKYFIGNGMKNLVSRALPETVRDDAEIERYVSAMHQEYGCRWSEKTRPYKGISELLDQLAGLGIRMVILSNKPHTFTKEIVRTLLPRWKFDAVFGERPPVPRKPDPSSALEIARLLGILPKDFLYLGDSGTDMKTANAAGMYGVGALWGFRKADELKEAGAKRLISAPGELIQLL